MNYDLEGDWDGQVVSCCREPSSSYPLGVTCWVTGDFPGDTVRGPYPNSVPPTVNGGRGARKGSGSRGGRPRVSHPMLDLAAARLKRYKEPKGPTPKEDVLGRFRKVVWFLTLGSFSPSFVCSFFKGVFPDYYRQLSYRGTKSSVMRAQAEACSGKLLLDSEFSGVLKIYRAGPWAHNAPDWLRAQYRDPLVDSVSGVTDSGKLSKVETGESLDRCGSVGGERANEPASRDVPEAGGEAAPGLDAGATLEDLQKEAQFFESWSKYSLAVPGTTPPTAQEVALGAKRGVTAVLEARQLHAASQGVSVSAEAAPGFSCSQESGALYRLDRIAVFLDEVAMLESLVGRALDLTSAEMREGMENGLLSVLSQRPPGSLGAGAVPRSVAPPPAEPPPAEPTPGAPSVPVSDSLGDTYPGTTAGRPDHPVVSEEDVSQNSSDSGLNQKSGFSPGSEDPDDLSIPVSLADSEAPAVLVDPKLCERDLSLKEFPIVMIVTPGVKDLEVTVKRCLMDVWRNDNFFAPACPVSVGDTAGLNIFQLSPVPEVWVLDQNPEEKYPIISDFAYNLGPARQYLVDSWTARKHGKWVLTDDNLHAVVNYYYGKNSKRVPDTERPEFALEFPKLPSAPKDWFSLQNLTLDRAKACFDEWRAVEGPGICRATPDLLDLVERGMGPGYWGLKDSFLLHWMFGRAVRQVLGQSAGLSPEGLSHRFIPLSPVFTPELAEEIFLAGFWRLPLWTSIFAPYTESLAPRDQAENLPGHRWVTGMGYLPEEVVQRILGVTSSEKPWDDPFLEGCNRKETCGFMASWARDVACRVKSRAWFEGDRLGGVPVYGFSDCWKPAYSLPCIGQVKRWSPSAPLFMTEEGLLERAIFGNREWLTQDVLRDLPRELSVWWDLREWKDLVANFQKLPVRIHCFSILAVTHYLRYLEQSSVYPSQDKSPLLVGFRVPLGVAVPSGDSIPFPSGDMGHIVGLQVAALESRGSELSEDLPEGLDVPDGGESAGTVVAASGNSVSGERSLPWGGGKSQRMAKALAKAEKEDESAREAREIRDAERAMSLEKSLDITVARMEGMTWLLEPD